MGVLATFLNILFVMFGIILIGLILLRRGEGGGLSGAFGGSSGEAVFGVRAAQTLDKLIASMAALFIFVSVMLHTGLVRPSGLSEYYIPKSHRNVGKADADKTEKGPDGAPKKSPTP